MESMRRTIRFYRTRLSLPLSKSCREKSNQWKKLSNKSKTLSISLTTPFCQYSEQLTNSAMDASREIIFERFCSILMWRRRLKMKTLIVGSGVSTLIMMAGSASPTLSTLCRQWPTTRDETKKTLNQFKPSNNNLSNSSKLKAPQATSYYRIRNKCKDKASLLERGEAKATHLSVSARATSQRRPGSPLDWVTIKRPFTVLVVIRVKRQVI